MLSPGGRWGRSSWHRAVPGGVLPGWGRGRFQHPKEASPSAWLAKPKGGRSCLALTLSLAASQLPWAHWPHCGLLWPTSFLAASPSQKSQSSSQGFSGFLPPEAAWFTEYKLPVKAAKEKSLKGSSKGVGEPWQRARGPSSRGGREALEGLQAPFQLILLFWTRSGEEIQKTFPQWQDWLIYIVLDLQQFIHGPFKVT